MPEAKRNDQKGLSSPLAKLVYAGEALASLLCGADRNHLI